MSYSKAFPASLSAQVEDLTHSQEDAHKTGHHHKDSEYLLLCGPEEDIVRDNEDREDQYREIVFSLTGLRSEVSYSV